MIVVAVLVIVVPEMLSGPGKSAVDAQPAADAGPPVRTFSLELGTPAAARTQDQSALTPQSSEPVEQKNTVESPPVPVAPVQRAPVQAAPVQAVPVQASPTPPAAAAPTESSPAVASKSSWWTQLGSFSSRDNAERLARDLRGKGYSVNVARIKVGAKDLYRVRAGPVATREAAVALQARLAAAGHKSSLVAP